MNPIHTGTAAQTEQRSKVDFARAFPTQEAVFLSKRVELKHLNGYRCQGTFGGVSYSVFGGGEVESSHSSL